MSLTKSARRNSFIRTSPTTRAGFLLGISYGQSVRAEEHGSFVIM
jgi:hypothetical protein